MPFASLTRLVAILIVGSIPLIWFYLQWPGARELFASAHPIWSGPALVVLAIVCGILVESAGDLLIRRQILRRTKIDRAVAKFFLEKRMYDQVEQWREFFRKALNEAPSSPIRTVFLDGSGTFNSVTLLRLATGIFLKEANKESFEWMSAADATAALCRNLVMVIVLIGGLDLWSGTWTRMHLLGAIAVPLLLNRAVNRDLFADLVILRFSTLSLLGKPVQTKI